MSLYAPASVMLERAGRPFATGRAMRRAGWTWGLIALAVYAATCAPGLGWQDSAIQQFRVVSGQLEDHRGLARSHPLHYWLARGVAALPLPLAEPALRLNLLSAACGALALGLLAALLAGLTHSQRAAAFGVLAALVAHPYWQMSVVTEVLSMSAALMALEWLLLWRYTRTRRPWLLVALFAVNGLHQGVHQFALFTLATYGVFLLIMLARQRIGAATLVACGLVWLAAGLPNWLMMADFYARHGSLAATFSSALFGGHAPGEGWTDTVLNVGISRDQARLAVLSLGYAFPSLALPVAAYGITRPAHRRQRLFRRVLVAQTVLIGAFVMRYEVPDLYTFFVPLCLLTGLWFGLGVHRLLAGAHFRVRRRLTALLCVHALWPVLLYAAFPYFARQHQVLGGQLRQVPLRDEYTYFFWPWRVGEDSAKRYSHLILDRAGPGGWILGDSTTAPAIAYYYLVHGGPPGVTILSVREFLVPPRPEELSQETLREHLRAGGHTLAVPGAVAELLGGDAFALDPTDPQVWHVGPAPENR